MLFGTPPANKKVMSAQSTARSSRLLAQRLRSWRTSKNLPLKRVAYEMGVSVSAVSDWERSNRFPSPEHLDLLAEHMKLPLCALLCDAAPSECPRLGR